MPLHSLPLIRGWKWRLESRTAVVALNQEVLIYSPVVPSELGWLTALEIVGTDAYLGLRLVTPGFDSGYVTFASINALGLLLPPPLGAYISLYNQPNPLRTVGQYSMEGVVTAFPMPFNMAARLYLSLRPGTTEPYATGLVGFQAIFIEDRDLFLKDLRKVKYGRWAPLMDLIGHVPLLRRFARQFEELEIPFEEKEDVQPPGVAR